MTTTILKYIPLTDIQVGERQRKKIAPAHVQRLKRSIVEKGLLHPIILTSQSSLVAGECRLRAMTELHEEGATFTCGSVPVPDGQVPFLTILDLEPADYEEAELEENVLRSNLDWQEEIAAKARIHELRKAKNPAQTQLATAKEIAEIKGETANVKSESQGLSRALMIARHLDNPKVAAAKNVAQASRIVLDDLEATYRAQLLEKTVGGQKQKHTLIHGDCREEMKKLPAGAFDLICSDPPYGIDADTMKQDSKHHYDDSAEYALAISKFIIAEGFRVTKPRAILFMFCDIEHYLGLREFAKAHAWHPWRAPLIFHKGNVGHAPWGRLGFTRTYETILFAVKGQRELASPGGPDVFTFPPNRSRVHAAEKPRALVAHLLSRALLPGQTVLDPCAGSGVIFSAASSLSVVATGIEKDRDYYNRALIRMNEPSPQTDEAADLDLDLDGDDDE